MGFPPSLSSVICFLLRKGGGWEGREAPPLPFWLSLNSHLSLPFSFFVMYTHTQHVIQNMNQEERASECCTHVVCRHFLGPASRRGLGDSDREREGQSNFLWTARPRKNGRTKGKSPTLLDSECGSAVVSRRRERGRIQFSFFFSVGCGNSRFITQLYIGDDDVLCGVTFGPTSVRPSLSLSLFRDSAFLPILLSLSLLLRSPHTHRTAEAPFLSLTQRALLPVAWFFSAPLFPSDRPKAAQWLLPSLLLLDPPLCRISPSSSDKTPFSYREGSMAHATIC